jgi:hypothetical protein
MKAVTDTLGVARSNIAERVKSVRRPRGPQTRDGDLGLAAEIRRLVDARPTYGYRRIAALLRRERRSAGLPVVNAKRVYRLMKKHGLLLAKHTGRRRQHAHDGRITTLRSNSRLGGLLAAGPSDIGSSACWRMMVLRCPGVHLLERRGGSRRLRPRPSRSGSHRLDGHDRRHLR